MYFECTSNLSILSGCRQHPKGRWLPFALHNGFLPVLKSRKAYCQWAGKTYRPERASCPRWPESSSMTPLRFYWICPLTVSRDNKNQKKSQSADAHLSSVINNLCHTGRYAVSIRYLPNSVTRSKEYLPVARLLRRYRLGGRYNGKKCSPGSPGQSLLP